MEKKKPRGSGAFFMGEVTPYYPTTLQSYTLKNQTQTPDPDTSQTSSHQRRRAAMDDDARFAVFL